jgi:4-amino-4-deoxy-L-arabinose transferase-like glycosyltransferase
MIAWVVRHTLGQSLLAIRFLPALAGAVEVVLTALIARELGGRRFTQVLAAITTLTAPGILAQNSSFTMNAFEPLFWMTCAYLVIRIIKTGNEKLWIWFGVVAGIGLENNMRHLLRTRRACRHPAIPLGKSMHKQEAVIATCETQHHS